jgi:hypothetical protein
LGRSKTFNGLIKQVTTVKCTASGVSYQKSVKERKFECLVCSTRDALPPLPLNFALEYVIIEVEANQKNLKLRGHFRFFSRLIITILWQKQIYYKEKQREVQK